MGGFERQRLYGALILLVTALFIAGGYPPLARWGRQLRIARSAFLSSRSPPPCSKSSSGSPSPAADPKHRRAGRGARWLKTLWFHKFSAAA